MAPAAATLPAEPVHWSCCALCPFGGLAGTQPCWSTGALVCAPETASHWASIPWWGDGQQAVWQRDAGLGKATVSCLCWLGSGRMYSGCSDCQSSGGHLHGTLHGRPDLLGFTYLRPVWRAQVQRRGGAAAQHELQRLASVLSGADKVCQHPGLPGSGWDQQMMVLWLAAPPAHAGGTTPVAPADRMCACRWSGSASTSP